MPWEALGFVVTVWALTGTLLLTLGLAAGYAIRQIYDAIHQGRAQLNRDLRKWEAELRELHS